MLRNWRNPPARLSTSSARAKPRKIRFAPPHSNASAEPREAKPISRETGGRRKRPSPPSAKIWFTSTRSVTIPSPIRIAGGAPSKSSSWARTCRNITSGPGMVIGFCPAQADLNRIQEQEKPRQEPARTRRQVSSGSARGIWRQFVARYTGASLVNAALRHPLNPLASPRRRLKGICEILCLVHDLAVAELHNAHRIGRSPLIGDRVFRDPDVLFSDNSPDAEVRRFAGMMTSQCLQILPPDDSFARLRIITDRVIVVDIVFRIEIAGCRRAPMRMQSSEYLFLWHLIHSRYQFLGVTVSLSG